MKKLKPSYKEAIGAQIIEEISQIQQISLGEGAATCQVCGSSLCEGEAVVLYAFRPAGEVMFQVGYVMCGSANHDLPKEYTLGVRELLVEGRIGVCSDGATRSSWPVLLDPEVLAVSAAATTSVRLVPDGGSPTNAASGVEKPDTPGSPTKLSLGEAQRRAGRPGDDTVRGFLWGERR